MEKLFIMEKPFPLWRNLSELSRVQETSFFAELLKLGETEARHIVSHGLLCEEPSAGLLADVEHRLAAAREDQKKANQRVAVHYSLSGSRLTKSLRALTWMASENGPL